jgi:hypothetical protein
MKDATPNYISLRGVEYIRLGHVQELLEDILEVTTPGSDLNLALIELQVMFKNLEEDK